MPLVLPLLLFGLLEQIVNICVDVITEERENGGKRLKEGLAQMYSGKPPHRIMCFFVFFCPCGAVL